MSIRQNVTAPPAPQSRWPLIAAMAVTAFVVVASALWALSPLVPHRAGAVPAAVVQTPDVAEAQAGPTGAPLLWVVKEGGATVYLFGSVHVLRQNLDWMDRRLFQAFDSADQAWFELPDLDAIRPFNGLQRSVMAPRPVLAAGLTEIEKAQLERILKPYGYTVKDLQRVKPWAMASMINDLNIAGGGFRLDQGADMTLFHRARDMKKTVSGFETQAQQVGFLTALALSEADGGTASLKRALAAHFGTGNPDDDINVLAKYWRTGNERALTAMVLRQRDEPHSDYDVLLRKRNAAWVPKIERMLADKHTAFITVGAAHLVGPDGLVAQLRARGHTVTRLDPA